MIIELLLFLAYGSLVLSIGAVNIRIESIRDGILNEQLDTELLVLFRNDVT